MTSRQQGLPLLLKKTLDRAVGLGGLLLTAPIVATAAIATRLSTGGPAFFSQLRPGLHGEPFTIYKLRTMADTRAPNGKLLPDSARLTKLGKFLRATSIDELPQLWNVVKGELSLVGPRPLLMEYLPLYSREQRRRHDVLPGITGWAQIHGRNAVEWERRFELDVWYVDNWSLRLDLEILAKTLSKVTRRDGISEPGAATMTAFRGSPPSRAADLPN
jgi:sugar transferase EpsL